MSLDDGPGRQPGGRVQPAGNVDRDHHRLAAAHHPDQLRQVAFDGPIEADSEEGIHHHGLGEQVLDGRGFRDADRIDLQATGRTLMDAELAVAGQRDPKQERRQSMR